MHEVSVDKQKPNIVEAKNRNSSADNVNRVDGILLIELFKRNHGILCIRQTNASLHFSVKNKRKTVHGLLMWSIEISGTTFFLQIFKNMRSKNVLQRKPDGWNLFNEHSGDSLRLTFSVFSTTLAFIYIFEVAYVQYFSPKVCIRHGTKPTIYLLCTIFAGMNVNHCHIG